MTKNDQISFLGEYHLDRHLVILQSVLEIVQAAAVVDQCSQYQEVTCLVIVHAYKALSHSQADNT